MDRNILIETINSNSGLAQDVNKSAFVHDNFMGILRNIEAIIPEKAKSNFYKNLGTLRISTNGDSSFSLIDSTVINLDKKQIFLVDNKITNDNGIDFSDSLCMEFYHELLHLASNTITVENGSVTGHGGFQSIIKNENGEYQFGNENDFNGLTEGFTQYLTLCAFNKNIDDDTSSYTPQINAVKKLIDIVGINALKEVYFDNRQGMEPIKKVLNEKGISPNFCEELEKACHVKEKTLNLQSHVKSPNEVLQYDLPSLNNITTIPNNEKDQTLYK